MELQAIRRNLLSQHENLRQLMKVLEEALAGGDEVATSQAVTTLHDTCQAHNAFEEAVLVPILRDIDAWGPERVKQMLDDHSDEHEVLLKLLVPTSSPQKLRDALGKLRAHMENEEATNLAEIVLRDDTVNVDAD